MKTSTVALATVFILAGLPTQAKAQEYGGSVLITGEGEVTLHGTKVDNILGKTRGKGKDWDGYETTDGLAQPVFFIPPVPRPVFPHQSGIICREFIVTEGRHGNFREVTKTVCRDRHGRHIDRHHWQDDDRQHWRDEDRHHWRDDRWQDRRTNLGGRNR